MIYIKKSLISFLIISLILFMDVKIVSAIGPTSDKIYQGIDVSNWQRNIDFSKVKKSGIEIVYIKASEGSTYIDSSFERNYENAKNAGLKVGFYHFVTSTTTENAKKQARFFASVIGGKAPDCKLAMDFEQFRNNISVNQINDISKVFIETFENLTGKQMIIYSNLYDSQKVFSKELASKYPLWLAYWGSESNLIKSNSNWNNWEGWQYTSTGSVDGINGYVDRNRFTDQIFLSSCTNCPVVETPEDNNDSQKVYYTVKRGDTLSQIAHKYNTTVQNIVNLNNIQNPNLIYPGQVLLIESQQVEEDCEMGCVIHIVRRGENLWNLAIRYNTNVQSIVELNNIQNPNLIYPGQELKIPVGTTVNSNNTSNIYIVKRGDCLWRIARRYGVSVRYLVEKNGIRNPNLIYVGQIIKI